MKDKLDFLIARKRAPSASTKCEDFYYTPAFEIPHLLQFITKLCSLRNSCCIRQMLALTSAPREVRNDPQMVRNQKKIWGPLL